MKDTAKPACGQPWDWGLPDWHDVEAYPDYRVVDIWKWRWEFLRRSPEYRTFWAQEVFPCEQAHRVAPFKDHSVAFSLEWLGDGRSPHVVLLCGAQEAREQFGLGRAYDPRQSDQVVFHLASPVDYWGTIEIEHGGNMAVLGFDLDQPLQAQVSRALAMLIEKQTFRDLPEAAKAPLPDESISDWEHRLELAVADLKKAPPRVEPRPRVDMFATYLRVLDAKEAGASSKAIAAVLYPILLNGVKTVINDYNAACRIRDKDYRLFAAVGGSTPVKSK